MAVFGKPRLLQLVEVASRAELLRRKRQARGVALRAGLGVGAVVFTMLLMAWLHLTAWAALADAWGPVGAAAAIAAFDLALVVGLGLFAGRDRVDGAADEAVGVRDAALRGAMMEVQTLGGVLRQPVGGVAAERPRRTVRVYPPPP